MRKLFALCVMALFLGGCAGMPTSDAFMAKVDTTLSSMEETVAGSTAILEPGCIGPLDAGCDIADRGANVSAEAIGVVKDAMGWGAGLYDMVAGLYNALFVDDEDNGDVE